MKGEDAAPCDAATYPLGLLLRKQKARPALKKLRLPGATMRVPMEAARLGYALPSRPPCSLP
jgi:hypothetical protein